MFDRLLEIERRWVVLPVGIWRGDDRGPEALPHRVVSDDPLGESAVVCASDSADVVEAVRQAPDDIAWLIREVRELRDERDALKAEVEGKLLVGKSRERGDVTLATYKIEKPDDE